MGHGQISDQAESEEPFRDNQQAGGLLVAVPSGIDNIVPLNRLVLKKKHHLPRREN